MIPADGMASCHVLSSDAATPSPSCLWTTTSTSIPSCGEGAAPAYEIVTSLIFGTAFRTILAWGRKKNGEVQRYVHFDQEFVIRAFD